MCSHLQYAISQSKQYNPCSSKVDTQDQGQSGHWEFTVVFFMKSEVVWLLTQMELGWGHINMKGYSVFNCFTNSYLLSGHLALVHGPVPELHEMDETKIQPPVKLSVLK